MTSIKLNYLDLEIDGHATGSVEVCAAVSALAQTLWLEMINKKIVHTCDARSGHFHLKAYPTEKQKDEVEHAFDVICMGLVEISKGFNTYVNIV